MREYEKINVTMQQIRTKWFENSSVIWSKLQCFYRTTKNCVNRMSRELNNIILITEL